LRKWRDRGVGPDWFKDGSNIVYPINGFDEAVAAQLAKNHLPPGHPKHKDPKRVAHMRAIRHKGPDAAIVKRLMDFIRRHAVRTERHGQLDYFCHAHTTGEHCFVFDGNDKLIDVIDPETGESI
jgi:hypothetical protein